MDQRGQAVAGGRRYADTADWTVNGPYAPLVDERRTATPSGLLLARSRQPAGHYPDPAVANYSVILFAGGDGDEAVTDMGAGQQTFGMRPGLVGVSPPDTACDYTQHGPGRFLLFGIPKERVASLSEQATGRPVADLGPCHQFFRDPLIEQVCLRMWDEAGHAAAASSLFLDAALNTLVSALLCRAGRSPHQTAHRTPLSGLQLRRVAEYIEDNLDADVGLADLAAVAHLSEYHFARLFKATTGQTPHQFVIEKRIERAKELVRAGRLTLVEVAAEVGFADQSHFTRHFKRLAGVTPKRFR